MSGYLSRSVFPVLPFVIAADVVPMQQMMSWSVIALSQVGLKNVHGFYATRALLGLLEGYVSIYPFGEPIYRQEMSFTSTVVSSPTLFCEPTSFG
jgi:hypothetical protein